MKELPFRLNRSDRESIIAKGIEHGLGAREKALAAEESSLGMDCYRSLLDPAVIRAVNRTPPGWIIEVTDLRFSFGAGQRYNFIVAKPVRVPERHNALGVVKDAKLNQRFLDLTSAKDELTAERKALNASLGALLDRFYTLKQLQEAWPEGAKLYAHLQPRKTAPVPAIQVSALNKALGLSEKSAT